MAQKWNPEKHEYEPYDLPKGAMLLTDMDTTVSCAQCGKRLKFGSCFTSKQVHNNFGLGYGVCESCYQKELTEER